MESTMVFCQSCAMPLEKPEDYGTERDNSKSADYCQYCYAKGAFTSEETMEGMIEACIPFTLEAKVFPTAEAARAAMMEQFPKLKRWAK
ncbi:MAG: zinc ribbon domain-containing protein [Clostridia bacterium]|nr:zinc ribbon domain-containing protein [Clostridia bacterium]